MIDRQRFMGKSNMARLEIVVLW